jgi:hypothetical protein
MRPGGLNAIEKRHCRLVFMACSKHRIGLSAMKLPINIAEHLTAQIEILRRFAKTLKVARDQFLALPTQNM